MVIGVNFNDFAVQNRFDHVLPLETFFDGMLHGMAFYEVLACLNALTNLFNVL
ncbi:MAG: hypothetical protein OHK0052_14360 [Anaerolineales bacterium]